MELVFLGTGPAKKVTQDGRTRSSLAVKIKETTFLIDCSMDFLEQVKRENIEKIDFILITHGHHDATGGIAQLKEWMKEKNIEKMPVWLEKETYSQIKRDFKDTSYLEINYFEPYKSFYPVKDLTIYPFRIIHSIQPGFPTVGFRVKGIVYSEDVGAIPEKSNYYYGNAKIIIFDAAMWFGEFIKGHYTVDKSLELAKKFSPETFILTQAGHTYPNQEEANKKIQEYWDKIKGDSKTDIILAHDGLKISAKDLISQNLIENKSGIILAEPHGRLIWEKKKKIIVRGRFYRTKINKILYLIAGKLCYGLIKLHLPDKINLKEFKSLQNQHLISETERRKWWPNKEFLYAYRFDIIKLYDKPREVEYELGPQTFVTDFKFKDQEFKNSEIEELIKDISSYDPKKTNAKQLADDWRIVNAWYSTKKSGGHIKFSLEDIINLAGIIYREIVKRVSKDEMKHEFRPDEMTPHARELYDIVSKSKTGIMSAPPKYDLSDPNLLKLFENKTLIKDFICVMGSYANHPEDYVPNDIDLLIRMEAPTDYLKRAVEVRIAKDIGFSDKIHFVWGDPEGPHDTFIPLYDLELKRVMPLKKVKMQAVEEELSSVLTPFKPPKTTVQTFFEIPELLDYLFKKPQKYAMEKKYDGFRGLIHKRGNEVKIFSDQAHDITIAFPTIVEQANQLTNKDLIIDGEIVAYEEGKPTGRADLAKFIGAIKSGKKLDDSRVRHHIFDILYFDKDIKELTWHERKGILHSLNFTKNIQEVHSVIVNSPHEAEKAAKIFEQLPGSEGSMIKIYDSPYPSGERTDAWIKYKKLQDIKVKVLDIHQIANTKAVNYAVGIDIPEKDKDRINPKYYADGEMLMGNTFNTSILAQKGDIIVILVEEVWRHIYRDDKIRYSFHKPKVLEVRKGETKTSDLNYLDSLVVSRGLEVKELEATTTITPGIADISGKIIGSKIIRKKIKEHYEELEFELQEEDTRGEAATKFWSANWQNMYSESGKGEFVYQHHWRGLSEDEAKDLTNEELLKTNHSIHGDLRLEKDKNELLAFTVFLGEAGENNRLAEKDRLIHIAQNKEANVKLQGTWKLAVPHDWLDVGKGKPTLSPPRGVGSTANKWAKFFAIDSGTYEMGVWREHSFEFFFNGKDLKGRVLISFVPVGGRRIWLIDFPSDQTPYAESHNLDDVKKELKEKEQKWLIWAKPGAKPQKIEIQ